MNPSKKGIIILTSTGLSADVVRKAAAQYFDALPHKSAAIITTAASEKENNKYSKLAQSQLNELGFNNTDFIDLEKNPSPDFSKYNVIYVCGGNTFKLLKYARQANFQDAIKKLLIQGGIYLGVSAGAIILAPTINAARLIDPDPNTVALDDFSGLNIVNFEIHPHYELEEEKEIRNYEKTYHHKIIRLSNNQALIVINNKKKMIKQ